MLADLASGGKLTAGGQRVAHTAIVVVGAADEALAALLALMRDQIAMTTRLGAHGALPHLEVGLVVGGALGVHALLVGLLAERLALDARRAALGAHGGLTLERAHLHAARHGIGHIAVGPTHAADKAAARLGTRLHDEVLAARGAGAHAGIGGDGVRDGLTQIVLVLDERVEHACEQGAGVIHDVLLRIGALGDLGHIGIELGGHVGRGDARRELRERVDDGDAELAGLDGVVLEVAHRIEALDDARARRLGAQAALFHLLDELALAVARGRLGLLGLELDVAHVDDVALGQRGQLLVALEAIRVGLAEAGLHQHVAAGGERFAADIDGQLGVLDGRRPHERRQEATGDEVVELELTAVERGGIALAGGMDRRVVGGLDLAARRRERAGEDLLAHGRERRGAGGQATHDALDVQRLGIHRVIDTGIGNETAHVEGLGDAHGARGADALGRRGRLQRGGVERHRRLLLAAALGHSGYGTGGRPLDMRVRRLGSRLIREARRGVGDLELLVGGFAKPSDLPVILRHEGHALALALDHQGERGGLDAAGGAHIAKAAELGEREVAREDRAPNEVDVLAGLAGVGQILVEIDQVGEGLGDLALDEGGVAGAARGQLRGHLADHVEGIRTDELALAVEVRGDDDLVGLFGEVLEDADDLLLRGVLDNRRPREVRQALDLPALDVNAIGKEGLALGVIRRAGKAVGHTGGQDLAVLGQAVPAHLLVEKDLVGEIRREDMAGQAH